MGIGFRWTRDKKQEAENRRREESEKNSFCLYSPFLRFPGSSNGELLEFALLDSLLFLPRPRDRSPRPLFAFFSFG